MYHWGNRRHYGILILPGDRNKKKTANGGGHHK